MFLAIFEIIFPPACIQSPSRAMTCEYEKSRVSINTRLGVVGLYASAGLQKIYREPPKL